MAILPTSNTGATKSIDRTAGGSKPDSTPATGTTPSGGGGTGPVTSVTGSVGVGASPTTGAVSVYLNTTGVAAATYGDSTHVPQITVNAEGQITSASSVAITSGGTGTVTSVGLSMPSEFTVTGSPITSSGTLTVTKASESANTFYGAPNGSAGTPIFRKLATADLPTGTGTVTGVSGSGSVNGITLSGSGTTSVNLTLGGTLSGIANSQLTNNSVTVTAGTGLSGGGTVALGSAITLNNTLTGVPSGGTVGQRLITNNSSAVTWSNDPMTYAQDYGFGAAGNTVTQNTTALQNAVNAAVAANGCLLLPAGSVHINSAITIGSSGSPFAGVIRIQGCGKLVSEIIQDSAVNGFTVYMANPYGENIGIEFEDLSVIGNNSACATAIYINTVQYGSIENRDLICINNVSVTGVVATNTGGWTNGFVFIGGWHILVTNCYAAGCLNVLPTTSGLGSGAGFLFQDCVNCKLDTVTAEWWNRGVSMVISSFTTQGVQINNIQTLNTINAIYNNGSTMYLTNFLFDNGNNFSTSWVTVNILNHFGSGYMSNGQILQNGGANQIYLNNSTGLMISNIDFTNQASLTGASVLLTNGTNNVIVSNCLFASAKGVQCDSGTSNNIARANLVPNGNLDSNSADTSTNTLGDTVGITTVPTLTGAATYSWSISIASACLGRIPRAIIVQRAKTDSTVTYKQMLAQWDYNNAGNSATTAYLVAFMSDGTNLPSAPERFMVSVLP